MTNPHLSADAIDDAAACTIALLVELRSRHSEGPPQTLPPEFATRFRA
jgi:hypothetical protein